MQLFSFLLPFRLVLQCCDLAIFLGADPDPFLLDPDQTLLFLIFSLHLNNFLIDTSFYDADLFEKSRDEHCLTVVTSYDPKYEKKKKYTNCLCTPSGEESWEVVSGTGVGGRFPRLPRPASCYCSGLIGNSCVGG